MAFREFDGGRIRVWGDPVDEGAVEQLRRCAETGDVQQTALMADHHLGYSQPIGGVVAYRGAVSPSGVGYDIGCGVKAVRTTLKHDQIGPAVARLADEIQRRVAFGLGRKSATRVDHELFDDPAWVDVPQLERLKKLAAEQLGTVGSGNHYVDLLVEEGTDDVWIAAHFGSRGFGHRVASGFLNLAHGRPFEARSPGESMQDAPTLLPLDSTAGQDYLAAMNLAGRYAYAGRDYVVGQVLGILGAEATLEVHNHHNFAWEEEHSGEPVVVVRKGATPAFPGQTGFVGGSMGDVAVIVRGVDSKEARAGLRSTVHGAGRVMSRTKAAGKRRKGRRVGGTITRLQMNEAVRSFGVVLRGGAPDESPHVYRRLDPVLSAHESTVEVIHRLRPIAVVMAGEDLFDPFKD